MVYYFELSEPLWARMKNMSGLSGLLVSQVVSLDASQLDVDKAERVRELMAQSRISNDIIFSKILQNSMREVNHLLETEREDHLAGRDEEDEKKRRFQELDKEEE